MSMPRRIKYRETMWATMSPDMYAGETCDDVRAQWETHEADGKGDRDVVAVLELAAGTFPPGTRVTIEEPCCPFCQIPIGYGFDPRDESLTACECGFDWNEWVRMEFA